MSVSLRALLSDHGIPLMALIRRDLLGGSRGAATLWARALAIIVAGGAALLCYGTAGTELRNAAAGFGAFALFAGLVLIGFLLGPSIALSSLRREREAGMLDLLLLAGIRAETLVLGRTISTWLFLQSLLLAALPGIALFWFFRRPGAAELALATAALSTHFFALSAVVVALSAWARNAGYAVALSLVTMAAWAGLLIAAPTLGWPGATLLMLDTALGGSASGAGIPAMALSDHVTGWMLNVAVGAAAMAAGIAGLRRKQAAAPRDRLRERIDAKPLPLRSGWALTWLLQRRSAPARPGIQACIIVPSLLASFTGGPEVAGAMAGLTVGVGLLAAVALGATAIAPERERGTWTSLISTGLPGRRLALDLVRGVLLGSCVPVLAGLAASIAAIALSDSGSSVLGVAVAGSTVLVTWMLAALAGLAGSLVSTKAATALALGGAMVVAEPALSATGAFVAAEVLVSPLDGGGIVAWLMLVAASAFGATWLMLRAGWRGWWKLGLAIAPTLLLSLLPLMLGAPREIGLLAPFVALGALGVGLLTHGVRRRRGGALLMGIMLLSGCVVMPLASIGMAEDAMLLATTGGSSWPMLMLDTAMGRDLPTLHGAALGLVHHAALSWAILVAFVPGLERWLGRAG